MTTTYTGRAGCPCGGWGTHICPVPSAVTSLLGHLMDAGYEPQETLKTEYREDWYDLVVSGIGSVRVCTYPDDGYRTDVYVYVGYKVSEWEANFSPGTPESVIVAALEAAEWQLAARRGGPVTPA